MQQCHREALGCLFGLLTLLGGCGDDRPGLAAARDAALAADSATRGLADGGASSRLSRPDGGPSLPSADREVVLPYGGPTRTHSLSIKADPGQLDVHFSIDTTGSFGGEINAMQGALRREIIPRVRARVEDVAFGVSRFEDFPVAPFGRETDRPFTLLSAITTDISRLESGVASLDSPLGHGADGPESGAEALYQIATGEGFVLDGASITAPFDATRPSTLGDVGGVGFRPGALRVVVHVTDAPAHDPEDYEPSVPGTRGTAQAIEALRGIGAHVIGISSGEPARAHLEALALGTGAATHPVSGTCATGIGGATNPAVGALCPLVFDISPDGSGLSVAIIDAIVGLVDQVRFLEVYGNASEDRLGFVHGIEATSSEPPRGTSAPVKADLRPVDGSDDTFLDVGLGTDLRFAVHLRNDTVLPADYDQVFHLSVEILGDGLVLVEERIRVVIPRGRLDGGPATQRLDGGADAGPNDAGDSATLDAGP